MGTQGGSRETIKSGETVTTGARPPGLAVGRLAETLGGGLVALVVDRTGAEIDDLTVAEPGHDLLGQPGDLVLGIAVADPDEAARLVAEVASRGGTAVLLRRALAEHSTVTDAATRHGLALLALSIGLAAPATWIGGELMGEGAVFSSFESLLTTQLAALAAALLLGLAMGILLQSTVLGLVAAWLRAVRGGPGARPGGGAARR